jgi:uncharacterized membrane protein HdeD (DUF308 family)
VSAPSGILFGIMAIAWPISTALAFAVLWGFWALTDGIGSLVQAFQPDAKGRVWLVVMGIVALGLLLRGELASFRGRTAPPTATA